MNCISTSGNLQKILDINYENELRCYFINIGKFSCENGIVENIISNEKLFDEFNSIVNARFNETLDKQLFDKVKKECGEFNDILKYDMSKTEKSRIKEHIVVTKQSGINAIKKSIAYSIKECIEHIYIN
ncbi:MAG: hypothetical protein IJ848_02925 [Alphaproteobacteria bacterium]|nr:hypothetical protein [Alphaproteobacteria bacterium]